MSFQNFINYLTRHKNPSIDFSDLFSTEKNHHKLLKLLHKYPTPIFICDPSIIQKRYQRLETLLIKYWGHNHAIAYSLKSNYQLTKSLKNLGAWAEVVSDFELNQALKVGFPGKKIIYNGPYKPNTSLKLAIKNQVLINIDNQEELKRLSSLTKRELINLGLRINIYDDVRHFGFNLDSKELKDVIDQINKHSNLQLVSLHCHLGSNIDKPLLYSKAALKLTNLANHLHQNHNIAIKMIDLGGGFPSHGPKPFQHQTWQAHSIDQYIMPICQTIRNHISFKPLPQLIFEPGRYLVDDSVVYLCQVIAQKNSQKRQVLITNGANTMLQLSYYQPAIIKTYSPQLDPRTSKSQQTIVYGATCKDDDCLYTGSLPKLQINDFIIFYCTGAYNLNLTPEFIFPKPDLLIL